MCRWLVWVPSAHKDCAHVWFCFCPCSDLSPKFDRHFFALNQRPDDASPSIIKFAGNTCWRLLSFKKTFMEAAAPLQDAAQEMAVPATQPRQQKRQRTLLEPETLLKVFFLPEFTVGPLSRVEITTYDGTFIHAQIKYMHWYITCKSNN